MTMVDSPPVPATNPPDDTCPPELRGEDGVALAAEMLRRMLRIRLFEEATIALFHGGELPAMVHLSIGQEAAVVGACLATTDRDFMTGNHRSHGHPIAKGADLRGLMAELLGKAGGVCGGKGGSMHLADFSVGSLGESGIVASAIPVATGAGLTSSVLGTGAVCLCFFGDGAANEGVFHESLNIASVWKLPVIYFCENNGYAVSVPMSESTAVPEIARRAAGYDMPGVLVDGQDVVATYRATLEAVERARSGGGPTLIEAKTYRFRGHSRTDPGRYRADGELERWKERDPIELLGAQLAAAGTLSADQQRALRAQIQTEVDASAERAAQAPVATLDDIKAYVYAP
jgi:TPP-dependent pyruvate/acetoin dehydrogenase alpha subunit